MRRGGKYIQTLVDRESASGSFFFPSLTVLCWKQVCLFSVSPSGVKVGGLLVVVEAGVKKKSFPLLWLPQFNTQKQRGEGRERERKGEKRKKKSNS